MAERNPIYDMMKGIGIILVLIGHMGFPVWVNQFIYSFHMPLFFLLAGYFMPQYSMKPFLISLKKNFNRLVVPYIVTMLLLIAWALLRAFIKDDYNMVIRHCLSLLWGSMDGINTKWGYVDNCPMWFLLALFWAKLIWEQLAKLGDKAVIIAIVMSIMALILHKWCRLIPWSIMQGLSSLTFIAIGWFFNHHSMPKWFIALCIVTWPIAMVFSHMDMASMVYQYYPMDILGAIGGTLCMYYLCSMCASNIRLRGLETMLCWFGMMSLTILCMHHFANLSDIGNSILIRLPFIENRMWINAIETSICIILAAIMAHVPMLNKIYK